MPTTQKRTVVDGERDLAEQALDTLRNLGVEARVDRKQPKDPGVNRTATLRRGAKRAPVQIEVKRGLRPGTLGPPAASVTRPEAASPAVDRLCDAADGQATAGCGHCLRGYGR